MSTTHSLSPDLIPVPPGTSSAPGGASVADNLRKLLEELTEAIVAGLGKAYELRFKTSKLSQRKMRLYNRGARAPTTPGRCPPGPRLEGPRAWRGRSPSQAPELLGEGGRERAWWSQPRELIVGERWGTRRLPAPQPQGRGWGLGSPPQACREQSPWGSWLPGSSELWSLTIEDPEGSDEGFGVMWPRRAPEGVHQGAACGGEEVTGCRTLCPLTSDHVHAGHSLKPDPHGDWGYTQQCVPPVHIPHPAPA